MAPDTPPTSQDAAPTLILGAGLAGLACSLELDRVGAPRRTLEAEARVGGLARSEALDGFIFDCTGHWMHLRDPETRALVEDALGDDAVWVERSAWIWSHGRMVPYPFQTNTWALPSDVTTECLQGFVDARWGAPGAELRGREPRTFREFVQKNLGAGIGRHFMFPYNEKLWTVDPDTLSPDWMGRFVPDPDPVTVLQGALGPRAAGSGYNARFVYPTHGGIQTLSDRLAGRLQTPVELERRIVSVDPAARTVTCEDGETLGYGHLVSTLPLPRLVEACEGAPAEVRAAAEGLMCTSLTYVNLGVKVDPAASPLEQHWVYFPERQYPFYRAGCASAAVPSLAPEGHRSFYVEFAHRGPLEVADPAGAAIEGLRDCGLLRDGDELVVQSVRTLPYAYVIFDRHHAENTARIQAWLDQVGIASVGRYGSWEYSSMEDALIAGRGAARRILEDTP